MKRFFALVLSLALLFLSSCAGKDKNDPTDKANQGNESSGLVSDSDLGDFESKGIEGQNFTIELFEDYDLTLVNVWATWCPPCVAEIPHLGQIAAERKGTNVNVVGILLDGVDQRTGKIDTEAIAKAKTILDSSDATYDNLLPDEVLFSTVLKNVRSIPTTFFVDRDGNIVGKPVVGAKDKKGWDSEIDKYLELI